MHSRELVLVDLACGHVLTRTGNGFRIPQTVQFLHNVLDLLDLWVGTHLFVLGRKTLF